MSRETRQQTIRLAVGVEWWNFVVMPHCTGPGAEDVFDPFDVDDVLERVVMPVVSILVAAQDLQRVDVGWGPREPVFGFWDTPPLRPSESAFSSRVIIRGPDELPTPLQADDELWVLVRASAHTWHSQLWQIESADTITTMAEAAYHLADQLEDWVCENVYWGQQAIANVTIPARRPNHP